MQRGRRAFPFALYRSTPDSIFAKADLYHSAAVSALVYTRSRVDRWLSGAAVQLWQQTGLTGTSARLIKILQWSFKYTNEKTRCEKQIESGLEYCRIEYLGLYNRDLWLFYPLTSLYEEGVLAKACVGILVLSKVNAFLAYRPTKSADSWNGSKISAIAGL